MSQSQAGMAQEGGGERGLAPDATAAVCTGCRWAAMSAGQKVRQFPALQIALEQLDGIEIWGVTGQLFDLQPGPLGGEVGPHPATHVRAQTVPSR